MRLIFGIVFLFLLVSSCSTPEFQEADLYGNWKLELADVDGFCKLKHLEADDCRKAEMSIRSLLAHTSIEFNGDRRYHSKMPGEIKEVDGSFEFDPKTREIRMFPVQDSLKRLNNQLYRVLKWNGEEIMVEDKDRLIFRFIPI